MSSSPKASRKFYGVINSTHGPDNIRIRPRLSQMFTLLLILTRCLLKYDVTGPNGVTLGNSAYTPRAKTVVFIWVKHKQFRMVTWILRSVYVADCAGIWNIYSWYGAGRAPYRKENDGSTTGTSGWDRVGWLKVGERFVSFNNVRITVGADLER